MKHRLLFTALIVALGFSGVSEASPVCDKLADLKKISQKMSYHPHAPKAMQRKKTQAVDCLTAEWRYLSKRLTFRGLKSASTATALSTAATPTDTIRYSPAAMYSANAATPIAFLKRPVVQVNYLPTTNYSATPLQQTALHLMDEVPTSNYQGSLATPIIYQTGHWNVNIDR